MGELAWERQGDGEYLQEKALHLYVAQPSAIKIFLPVNPVHVSHCLYPTWSQFIISSLGR